MQAHRTPHVRSPRWCGCGSRRQRKRERPRAIRIHRRPGQGLARQRDADALDRLTEAVAADERQRTQSRDQAFVLSRADVAERERGLLDDQREGAVVDTEPFDRGCADGKSFARCRHTELPSRRRRREALTGRHAHDLPGALLGGIREAHAKHVVTVARRRDCNPIRPDRATDDRAVVGRSPVPHSLSHRCRLLRVAVLEQVAHAKERSSQYEDREQQAEAGPSHLRMVPHDSPFIRCQILPLCRHRPPWSSGSRQPRQALPPRILSRTRLQQR